VKYHQILFMASVKHCVIYVSYISTGQYDTGAAALLVYVTACMTIVFFFSHRRYCDGNKHTVLEDRSTTKITSSWE